MTFDEAVSDIESYDFAGRMGIASRLSIMLQLAWREESVQALLKKFNDPQGRGHLAPTPAVAVLNRIQVLTSSVPDPGYRHPADRAIAVYLSVLHPRHPDVAFHGALLVPDIPQYWWSRQMAGIIRRARPFASRSLVLTVGGSEKESTIKGESVQIEDVFYTPRGRFLPVQERGQGVSV